MQIIFFFVLLALHSVMHATELSTCAPGLVLALLVPEDPAFSLASLQLEYELASFSEFTER